LAVAATDNPKIVAPVNETTNIEFLPFNDEGALKKYFEEEGENVSAVIVEAIQGVGGINVAAETFLQLVRKLCDEHDAIFIADEVQCGYGRSGKFFALDHAGVHADIYTMAKGMGNGFPVGGILIAPYIKPKHGMLGTTFGGNHLACAAALAVLEVMEQENLIELAKQRGMYLINKLKNIDGIENVRGKGLMIGFDVPEDLKDLRTKLLNDHFIFTGEAKPNVIRLLPALNISKKQVDEFLDVLQDAIADIRKPALIEA
jgi:acetylornithine aminotransferase